MGKRKAHQISSLVPGVMAQTGMETMEIIRGVIRETDPDAVIAIDALAARSVRRLNCTIQITDTGINPGSGVCNHRCGLNEESGRGGDGRVFAGTDHAAVAQNVCYAQRCG